MVLKKIIQYWKSTIIITFILFLSFAKPSTFTEVTTFTYIDKVVHMLMFLGLSIVLMYDYNYRIKKETTTFTLICILFPILLGGFVEIMQGLFFFPRSAEWFDWFADITGVLLGWIFMKHFFSKYFWYNKN